MPQVHRISKRTVHHKVPRSRNGSNHRTNRVRLDARWHDTLHAVFGNATPNEYFEILNRESVAVIKRLVRALIRNFGVSVIRDALH